VASRFGVSISYVIKARQRRDRTGDTEARKARRTRLRRLSGHEDALSEHVRENIDATLAELQSWLSGRGVQLGTTALWTELARLGLTLKKSRSARPNRIAPTSRRSGLPGAQRKAA
jgi:transposase